MAVHQDGGTQGRPDYRHAVPVLVLIVIAVGVGLFARAQLVPETFGRYGHYRAAAMDDERARGTKFAGSAVCAECHDGIAANHAKDAHGSVACETCHGPGAGHSRGDPNAPMVVAGTQSECLVCHRILLARPGSFPQIDVAEHFKFVGVRDPATSCISCHSAHTPLFMDKDLRQARLHPLIQACGDCHVGRTDDSLPRPPSHPQIFQCEYCHADITKSFQELNHNALPCTTCHLFIKENAFSGRIVRDNDPRFCLLCHRQADFRDPDGPPTISWPEHLADMAGADADPATSCTLCHQDHIHALNPKGGGS